MISTQISEKILHNSFIKFTTYQGSFPLNIIINENKERK